MRSLREIHDRVSFIKNGEKITGAISDFYYDANKNTMVAVRVGSELHFVMESELD